MSKVRCLYCDTVFEYSGQNRCPSCGASLSGNPDAEKAVLEEKERTENADRLRQRLIGSAAERADNAERTGRFVNRVFLPIFIIIFIAVFAVILISFLTMSNMFFW